MSLTSLSLWLQVFVDLLKSGKEYTRRELIAPLLLAAVLIVGALRLARPIAFVTACSLCSLILPFGCVRCACLCHDNAINAIALLQGMSACTLST